jgi:hypothetical protein
MKNMKSISEALVRMFAMGTFVIAASTVVVGCGGGATTEDHGDDSHATEEVAMDSAAVDTMAADTMAADTMAADTSATEEVAE